MKDIFINLRIMLFTGVLYFFGKFILRPYVKENEASRAMEVFVYSLPNFCEAVMGVLFLTNILLIGNYKFLDDRINENLIYVTATISAAFYVILQEMKFHNLGGQNIYDFNDVVFSIIGLVLTFVYLLVKKPQYKV